MGALKAKKNWLMCMVPLLSRFQWHRSFLDAHPLTIDWIDWGLELGTQLSKNGIGDLGRPGSFLVSSPEIGFPPKQTGSFWYQGQWPPGAGRLSGTSS